ncbi:GspE/PulE family protein, partial [Patescibacteria group bacterium]
SKTSTIPYIDLSDKVIPKEILQKVPEYIAQLYKAVPVEEKDGKLMIAMVDPEDFQAINFIRKAVGSNIQISLTTQKDIEHVLTQYSGLQSRVEKVISATEIEKQENKIEKPDKEEIEDDTPVAKIVNSVLNNAVGLEASDIHIEPKEKEVEVRFRVDGVLQKNLTLPKKLQSPFVSRIKILCNMKIDEQRLPQDGRFKLGGERPVDFRVSSFPTVFGEKVVMRILDKSQGILTLEQLGLNGNNLKVLRNGIHKSHGMTLVTGPTGSGKTTTLYAVLQELMDVGVNIVTLEDPVEYQIAEINQGQVRSNIGFTFASGLRSIVRQDPDIIMVGEVRDLETAELAVQSALTGHIVLSTLHTNDSAGAIPRLINMGVEPFLITSSINTVVAQRLARKICDSCKEEEKISPEILEDIKKTISVFPPEEKTQYSQKPLKGKGCEKCNKSGYKKRIGIFEILNVSDKIKSLALQKVSSSDLEKQARMEGMISMKQDGIMKALDGMTSIEEVWRITKE